MKKIIYLLVLSVIALPALAQPLMDTIWTRSYNSIYNNADTAYSVALDTSGRFVYLAGTILNTMPNQDIVLIKYDAVTAETLWTRRYDNGGWEGARNITLDDSGNIYIVGYRKATAITPKRWLVLRYNSNGSFAWADTFTTNPAQDEEATDCALFNNQWLYVVGNNYQAGTGNDVCLYRINCHTGVENNHWSSILAMPNNDMPYGCAVDASDTVWVCGKSYDPYSMGTGDDYFVLKTGGGTAAWSQTYSASASATVEVAYDCVIDDLTNSVYVVGRDGLFDDLSIMKFPSHQFPANTDTIWYRTYNTGTQEEARGCALDKYGNPLIVGISYNTGNSLYQVPFVKYSSFGVPFWSRVLSVGNMETRGYDCAYDAKRGKFYVGGCVNSPLTDFLLMKYGVPAPLPVFPTNGAVMNTFPKFTWRSVAVADTYMMEYGYAVPAYQKIGASFFQADTSYQMPSEADSVYYWRVKAFTSSLLDSSDWSPYVTFTIDRTPPAPPTLTAPANGTITNNKDVTFAWNPVAGAALYHIQVSTDIGFVATIKDDSTGSNNYFASGLPDAIIYWRVRARDVAGNWSSFFDGMFTVDTQGPEITNIEPDNGETAVLIGREIMIAFSEPISNGYTFSYSCNPDPGSWWENWSTTRDTVWLSHNYFDPGTGYTFQLLNAYDNAGNNLVSGAISNPWYFTTEDYDYTPPVIDIPNTNYSTLTAGSGITFQVNINDDVKMGMAWVYWGTAGDNGYNFSQLLNANGSSYETSIAGDKISLAGVQYQVEAVDSAGNYSYYPAGGDYYIHSVFFTSPINTNIIYDKWQMLSIPTDARNTNIFGQVSNTLGPYDNTKWRLYEWAGGAYHEISTISGGNINDLGRAYWLRHRTGFNNISFPGQAHSYGDFNQSKPCSLDLYTGWNDIGTPFLFDINWSNVYLEGFSLPTYSDSIAGPYYYDGVRWLLPNEVISNMSFASYQGFSFRNDYTAPRKLEIYPTSAKKKDGKSATVKSPNGWQALVVVENQAGSDHNYFGLSSDASIERDQYDYPEPPSGLTGASGYFRLADDQFCTDIRPELGDGQTWNFAVECNGSTKLAINLPVDFPAGTECYLADLTRQISVNIGNDDNYSFIPETGEQTREFRIIVGSNDYAKQVLGRTFSVPVATVLGQNLPNPFSGRTSISYELAAEGKVRIAVYNVAGQLVRNLLDEHQMTGRYSVIWDGKDQAGRKVSAGLYFYQLQAPNRTVTRRMALVR